MNRSLLGPAISIVVLNWNGKDDSLECLTSLRSIDYPRFDVVFADNGSVDGSIDAVRSSFPEVKIVENGKNLGYAEGNNRAIRYAFNNGAEAVVVLNNDTIADPGLLRAFADAYEKLPDAGMLGAVSFHYDRPQVIAAAGGYWDPVALRTRHIAGHETVAKLPSTDPFIVEYIVGCAVFVPKETVTRIGYLDSDFFLNGEDVDWGLRVAKNNLVNYTVPAAKIWHKVAVSFGGNSPLWWYFMTRNTLLWTERHLTRRQHRALAVKTVRALLPPTQLFPKNERLSMKARYWRLRTWMRLVRSPRGKAEIKARFFGLVHYYQRRFGDCPQGLRTKLLDVTD
jgi:hypothetical protein